MYVISVAAQLSGLHPQTLRTTTSSGWSPPAGPRGRGRRYSLRDVLALREVQRLSQEEGVNLSGIKRILELDQELGGTSSTWPRVTAELAQLRAELESTRAVAARLAGLLRSRAGSTVPAGLVPVRAQPGGRRGQPSPRRPRRGREQPSGRQHA